jgi:hypothetical protein
MKRALEAVVLGAYALAIAVSIVAAALVGKERRTRG